MNPSQTSLPAPNAPVGVELGAAKAPNLTASAATLAFLQGLQMSVVISPTTGQPTAIPFATIALVTMALLGNITYAAYVASLASMPSADLPQTPAQASLVAEVAPMLLAGLSLVGALENADGTFPVGPGFAAAVFSAAQNSTDLSAPFQVANNPNTYQLAVRRVA